MREGLDEGGVGLREGLDEGGVAALAHKELGRAVPEGHELPVHLHLRLAQRRARAGQQPRQPEVAELGPNGSRRGSERRGGDGREQLVRGGRRASGRSRREGWQT